MGLAVAVALPLAAADARAESLDAALAKTYLGNPTLNAARAGQRATDEQVPQALSGWRPTVTVTGTIGHDWTDTTSYKIDDDGNPLTPKRTVTTTTSTDPGSVTISLAQPLFRGFATVEGTRSAESTVLAGQQNLLATEQSVLFSAVQAYMDVYARRQLVALQQENVKVLEAQLDAANERFKVGEITRTDVAQAQASLSLARGDLASARANLAAAMASYIQVVGGDPGKLAYPRIPKLPANVEAAIAIAEETNPSILAAAFVEDASVHRIGVARAPLLPQLAFQADASMKDDLGAVGGHTEEAAVAGVLTIPLYEAGAVYSRVREAKQLASQRRIEVIEMARAVRQAVAASWSLLSASRQLIAAAADQVKAAKLALDGVRQEFAAGTRTTLDVLDAQAVVVSARTNLVNAQRNQVIAAYQLLSAIGHLTARDLGLDVPYYDAEENYRRVRNKLIGTDANTVE
jgi:TolC family type I secretion outer membrane protein